MTFSVDSEPARRNDSLMPQFFVPGSNPDNCEETYASYAKWCGKSVPPSTQRLYSITYVHNGDEWVATVGETLSGKGYPKQKRRGNAHQRTMFLSDPAMVLAIFPGDPYFVVTNHRIAGNLRSAWENPFMAGRPTSVTYFSR